jgi:hypothetical protein
MVIYIIESHFPTLPFPVTTSQIPKIIKDMVPWARKHGPKASIYVMSALGATGEVRGSISSDPSNDRSNMNSHVCQRSESGAAVSSSRRANGRRHNNGGSRGPPRTGAMTRTKRSPPHLNHY